MKKDIWKLDTTKTLRDQKPKLYSVIDLLTPNLNHTHKHLIPDTPKHSAKDLTVKQIVDNATPGQLKYLRDNGLI